MAPANSALVQIDDSYGKHEKKYHYFYQVLFACLLFIVSACTHRAITSSVPENTRAQVDWTSMEPDQVNTDGWNKAWTNLLNNAEQSFTPSLPRLLGVEVELVVGNAGAAEDQLTLTVLDAAEQTIVVISKTVATATSDHVLFTIPSGGVEVSPGETYRLKLTGGTTYGWKYIVGGYERGEATFNRKPLLSQARSSFLFRTFGAK